MTAAREHLRWFSSYWISRIGALLGRFLPTRFWYAIAAPIADLSFSIMAHRRRHLVENLERVVGKEAAPAAARGVFHNFARYVIDFYQLPAQGPQALQRRIEFNDWERLNVALPDDGRGTVFVTLHLGQAELGAAAMSAYGKPVNVIANTLDYPPMDGFIQGLRKALGMNVIAESGAKKAVLRCLGRGEVLAMMLDAEGGSDRLQVEFFGAPAVVSGAPARIALRTGARVLTAVVARDPRDPMKLRPAIDFDLCFAPTGDEDKDVVALTEAMARSFEGFVRQYPDQWFAFEPVWAPGGAAKAAAPQIEAGGEAWRLWALRVAVSLGGVLPRAVSYALARLAGDAAFYGRSGARSDVEDNMRHVMGPNADAEAVRVAARDAFRNVARYYIDLIRIPKTDAKALLNKHSRLHGFDKVKSRLDAGRGVIVATAHYGNPEMAVQVGTLLGLNLLVLAEPLEPPAFARLMQDIRAGFGPRYVDVGYKAIAESLRHLRAGGCLAIACDRDIQGNGTLLPFFGVETPMPLGAAELAARTGAALIPGYCRRAGDGFDIFFEDPVDLVDTGRPKEDAITNALALLARVEPWLRADPGQWFVLERIWKAGLQATGSK